MYWSLELLASYGPSRCRSQDLACIFHICVFFKHIRFFSFVLQFLFGPMEKFLCNSFGFVNNSSGDALRGWYIFLFLLFLAYIILLYLLIHLIILLDFHFDFFNLIHSPLLKLLSFSYHLKLFFLKLLLFYRCKLLNLLISFKIYFFNFYHLITFSIHFSKKHLISWRLLMIDDHFVWLLLYYFLFLLLLLRLE